MNVLFAQNFPGMGLIPLMLLAVGGAGLFSVIGFFAAFFHRGTARVCAALSFGAAALFALLILMGNRWDFSWLLSVLREWSPSNRVVYSSLLLSLVAAFIPLRRAGGTAPDGTRGKESPRWGIFALACLTALLLLGYGVMQLIEERRGEQKTFALLAGDPSVRFERFQIDYQQRRVICTDPEVLRYLEERFRRHDRHRLELGTTYQLAIDYQGGGHHAFGTYWSESGDFSLSLPEHGDGGPSHGILLTRPRPRPLEEMIRFLCQKEGVAGVVLILEPGGVHRERDQFLVAE
jgi:hypothetical protein